MVNTTIYRIELNKKADKDLYNLSAKNEQTFLRVVKFLEKLETIENPFSLHNAKKMEGFSNKWRWRVGDYRIVGLKQDEILTIEIIQISPGKNAYK